MTTTTKFAALLAFTVTATASAETNRGTIVVNLRGFANDDGQALLALYDKAEAFPRRSEEAIRRVRVPVKGKKARLQLTDLPYKSYAISVFHDENGNGKLDTNLIGIPTERLGASNNARAKFGPPSWQDAHFPLDQPEVAQNIELVDLF
jgi:uncharacterized protein (DUF2141 family)